MVFATFALAGMTVVLVTSTDQLLELDFLNPTLLSLYVLFFLSTCLVSFLSGLYLYILTSRLIVDYQKPNLAIMVGVGGFSENISSRLIAQGLLVGLLSNTTGIIGGLLFVVVIVFALNLTGSFLQLNLSLDWLLFFFLGIWLLLTLTAYIVMSVVVQKALAKPFEDIVAEEVDPAHEVSFVTKLVVWGRDNLGTKLARINVQRASHLFFNNLVAFALLSFFLFSLVVGSMVVRDTTTVSLEGVFGEGTYAVVKEGFSGLVEDGFRLFPKKDPPSNLTKSYFSITALQQVLESQGLSDVAVDDRVGSVERVQARDGYYASRYDYLYVFGIDPDNLISTWRYNYDEPHSLAMNEVNIGEWVERNMMRNATYTELLVPSRPSKIFGIRSVLQDPSFRAKTVYMNQDVYIDLFDMNPDLRNLCFIPLPPSTLIESLSDALGDVGLILIPLDPILDSNKADLRVLEGVTMSLTIPTVFGVLVTVANFTGHVLNHRREQLAILKAVGGQQRLLTDVVNREVLTSLGWGSLMGMLVACWFVTGYLVRSGVLSATTIICAGVLFAVLLWVGRMTTAWLVGRYYGRYLF